MRRRLSSWRGCTRGRAWLVLMLIGAFAASGAGLLTSASGGVALAQLPPLSNLLPLNDLLALGQGFGQTPAAVPVQRNPEPPLAATPRAVCAPGSHPLAGMQGRVPGSVISSGAAAQGFTCNLALLSHQGQSGGFKVYRYIDRGGHECAFYDTALLYPLNAISLAGPPSLGVAVLDMSDPAHPVQSATLTSFPMLSPHESLNLNARRGLLAAVLGNPATLPGLVSIYDVGADCRHPTLDSTSLVARFGHESGFSADGRTFYATGTALEAITAIDVTDPVHPHAIWQGNEYAHGMTISDDGNRGYVADPVNGQLLILDLSQIQARAPNPQVREISRLTWGPATIPQNAMPLRIHGKPYLLEFDEYAFRFNSLAPPDTVGAGRLIDVSDERHPRVVSNLRLEVNQPAGHHAASGDPGAFSPVQGYAAHYCNVPREIDPGIVACSFISSGLRVFDIRDPLHPREVAYYIAPPKTSLTNGAMASDFAMSKPAFAPERREIWYSDGASGLYVLRVPKAVWPDATGAPAQSCPKASGRLARSRLGRIALGERRARVRSMLPRFSTRKRVSMDFFCLVGAGVRAGYPSRRLLRSLGRSERRRVAGRVVLLLSADRYYALRGIRPGTSISAAARVLHTGPGYRIGLNTWYIAPGRVANGVLKVRHGVIEEIGIADKRLTTGRATARWFLASFS